MIKPNSQMKKQDLIYIGISRTDVSALGKIPKSRFEIETVQVIFELKYSYFHHLHKALDLLSPLTIQRLIPMSKDLFCSAEKPPSIPWPRDEFKELLALDSAQMEALKAIIHTKPGAPVIIAGSFGTGKTRLLARAAYQILELPGTPRPRVLVCAHHQASADAFLYVFASMIELNQDWRVNMVRMILRPDDREKYNYRYHQFCATAHELSQKLHSIQLFITTFANCLHLENIKASSAGFFTHILVDEGAQTREPEAIAPLFLSGHNTVIAIAGDHKQVSRLFDSWRLLPNVSLQENLKNSLVMGL